MVLEVLEDLEEVQVDIVTIHIKPDKLVLLVKVMQVVEEDYNTTQVVEVELVQ
tara:strand:- start:204 stop:362 length:159 start_codon:yes stop_codon:yes gene_type:complete